MKKHLHTYLTLFLARSFSQVQSSLTVKLAHDNKTLQTRDDLKVNAPQLTSKDIIGLHEQIHDLNNYSLYNNA